MYKFFLFNSLYFPHEFYVFLIIILQNIQSIFMEFFFIIFLYCVCFSYLFVQFNIFHHFVFPSRHCSFSFVLNYQFISSIYSFRLYLNHSYEQKSFKSSLWIDKIENFHSNSPRTVPANCSKWNNRRKWGKFSSETQTPHTARKSLPDDFRHSVSLWGYRKYAFHFLFHSHSLSLSLIH